MHEHATGAVDGAVGNDGGNDFALQGMHLHHACIFLLQRGREVSDERSGDIFVIDQIRFQKLVEQLHLAVRQQYRTFWRRESLFPRFALAHFFVARQEFHGTVESPGFFQMANKTCLRIDQFFAAHA